MRCRGDRPGAWPGACQLPCRPRVAAWRLQVHRTKPPERGVSAYVVFPPPLLLGCRGHPAPVSRQPCPTGRSLGAQAWLEAPGILTACGPTVRLQLVLPSLVLLLPPPRPARPSPVPSFRPVPRAHPALRRSGLPVRLGHHPAQSACARRPPHLRGLRSLRAEDEVWRDDLATRSSQQNEKPAPSATAEHSALVPVLLGGCAQGGAGRGPPLAPCVSSSTNTCPADGGMRAGLRPSPRAQPPRLWDVILGRGLSPKPVRPPAPPRTAAPGSY